MNVICLAGNGVNKWGKRVRGAQEAIGGNAKYGPHPHNQKAKASLLQSQLQEKQKT